uniref:Uncharacterized protein n=1 Tax=Anguilla anguilla TaxID=7936 RepID=A0A0E9SMZ6_ANGAN
MQPASHRPCTLIGLRYTQTQNEHDDRAASQSADLRVKSVWLCVLDCLCVCVGYSWLRLE